MPAIIDPETLYVDDLPGIWSPVQWELSEAERIQELETQATASLLWAVDAPETILRLLLNETDIERAYEAPPGYDPEQQGEWDSSMVTYQFKRPIRMDGVSRTEEDLVVVYDFGDRGYWEFTIGQTMVTIKKV